MLRNQTAQILIDPNVYVSSFITPQTPLARVVAHIWNQRIPLASKETFEELVSTFQKPKFKKPRYCECITSEKVQQFLESIHAASEIVVATKSIRFCRDPKDDWIFQVAVTGRADLILTGDKALLVLNSFQDIPILNPAAYLKQNQLPTANDMLKGR